MGDRHYHIYDAIVLPLDTATGRVIAPGALAGSVETLKYGMLNDSSPPLRPSAAWASVEGTIMHDAEFGSMIRSIHVYSANLLIAAVVMHMFSVFFTDAPAVPDYATAAGQDAGAFKAFFHAMLDQGVYLPPSAFEVWFCSSATTTGPCST